VVRSLLALNFYKFRCFLEHRAKKEGVRLFIINESYTSKVTAFVSPLFSAFSRGPHTFNLPSTHTHYHSHSHSHTHTHTLSRTQI